MKRINVLLLLCLLFSFGFSQTSRDAFFGKFTPTVKKEKLNNIFNINELIPNCPAHWDKIIDFVSVNIMAVCNGQITSYESLNDGLTWEQRNMLGNADEGTDICVKIKFKWKTEAPLDSDKEKIQEMNEYRYVVVPSLEAEYPGGFQEVTNFLEQRKINKLTVLDPSNQVLRVMAVFTINEDGTVQNAKITKPSKNTEADKLLLEAINKMPKWKPAENAQGIKVKQDIVLRAFEVGC